MKILITSGGTREYIDAVRFLSNVSTGRTGAILADFLSSAQRKITCLCGQGAIRPSGKAVRILEFTGFKDLDNQLHRLLRAEKFDVIIHLAAVSDYSIAEVKVAGKRFQPGSEVKITSDAPGFILKLRRNFKIIDQLKKYAKSGTPDKQPLVIGFKLTSGASEKQINEAIAKQKSADITVHNDLAKMKNNHIFNIYRSNRKLAVCQGAKALAQNLLTIISEENICS